MATPVNELPAVDPDSGRVNVVVDTPRGSRTGANGARPARARGKK